MRKEIEQDRQVHLGPAGQLFMDCAVFAGGMKRCQVGIKIQAGEVPAPAGLPVTVKRQLHIMEYGLILAQEAAAQLQSGQPGLALHLEIPGACRLEVEVGIEDALPGRQITP